MTKNVNVRFDDAVHARLVAAAKAAHRSLQGQIEEYIDRGLTSDDAHGREVVHKDGNPGNSDPANLAAREAGE